MPGNRGYKYFGAAKDLPGVRELFEQELPPPPRKTRAELMKDITASYYGYLDDDDGILIALEEKVEKLALQQAIEEWKEKVKKGEAITGGDEDENIYVTEDVEESNKGKSEDPMSLLGPKFTSHVDVPTQKDIEDALLRKKKRELLAKYALEDD